MARRRSEGGEIVAPRRRATAGGLTLRRLRSWMARGGTVEGNPSSGVHLRVPGKSFPGIARWVWAGPVGWDGRVVVSTAHIDRLTSRYGPDVQCDWHVPGPEDSPGEDRAKDTSEVAETSEDPGDGDLHGGDGASGEVENPEDSAGSESSDSDGEEPSQGGEDSSSPGLLPGNPDGEPSEGEPGQQPGSTPGQGGSAPSAQGSEDSSGVVAADASAAGSDGTSTDSVDGPPDGGGASPREGAGDDPTDAGQDSSPTPTAAPSDKGKRTSPGTPGAGPHGPGQTDTPERDAPEAAWVWSSERADGPKADVDCLASGAAAAPDAPPSDRQSDPDSDPGEGREVKTSFGGFFAEFSRGTRRNPVDPRDVREIRRHLRRLLDRIEVEPGGEMSPRISAKGLVRELASRRVALSRARREEVKPAVRLILADVSGSCAAACRETVAAAQALAEDSGARCIAVLHSNGYPLDVLGEVPGGALPRERERQKDSALAWWDRLVGAHQVSGVVWLGDADGLWVLEHLARHHGAPVVWLDSYRSRVAGLHEAPRQARMGLSFTPRAMWWGVNDARSTAIALRRTHKGGS